MTDKNQELSEIFKSMGNPQGGVVSMEHAREAILIERTDLPEVALVLVACPATRCYYETRLGHVVSLCWCGSFPPHILPLVRQFPTVRLPAAMCCRAPAESLREPMRRGGPGALSSADSCRR